MMFKLPFEEESEDLLCCLICRLKKKVRTCYDVRSAV